MSVAAALPRLSMSTPSLIPLAPTPRRYAIPIGELMTFLATDPRVTPDVRKRLTARLLTAASTAAAHE